MAYARTFAVTGSGAFPLDMLRYDGCFPLRQDDVHKIDGRGPDQRTVQIRIIGATKAQTIPTFDRWRSFGWEPDCLGQDAERF